MSDQISYKTTSFQDIPSSYLSLIKSIENDTIKSIYSQFSYKYINCQTEIEETEIFLLNYLSDFKLITCEVSPVSKINKKLEKELNCEKVTQTTLSNLILCVENECIIIEYIDMYRIQYIMKQIKSSLIDVSKKCDSNFRSERQTIEALEEVQNFCNHFKYYIKENLFVEYTICPIIAYLIRRFYYPSNYFKDPSFFNFNENDNENKFKNKVKKLIFDCNECQNEFNLEIEDLKNNQHELYNFDENDFIILRCIYCNMSAQYYLTLHIKSLHIFLMKSIDSEDNRLTSREIKFCSKYYHQCFVHCYGFVKRHSNIKGIIYEYMCNGSICSAKDKISEIYIFTIIIRIFAAIEYLHKNCLIHRDLKPSNILINHDYMPYISDFDTIRLDMENDNEEFTNDIGSYHYSSPEQDKGLKISYPTDIYSFGLIVYFLFEKKDMINDFADINKQTILPLTNAPKEIQYIYNKCILRDPSHRLSIQEIREILYNFFLSPSFIEYLILDKNASLDDFINFYCDAFIFFNYAYMNNKFKNTFLYLLYFFKNRYKNDISIIFNNLGYMYYAGLGVTCDHKKAIQYYKLSAENNYLKAYVNLGILYYKSLYIKDYEMAKFCFEKCAKCNDPDAYYYLGKLYYKDYGIKKDIYTAKKYFESAALQNHSLALNILGMLYFHGAAGVKIDYKKAKEYFERASRLNYSNSIFHLGQIYYHGLGVETNYIKAQNYFYESSRNNPEPYFYLSFMYENGKGVKQDIPLAIELYFRCASVHDYITTIKQCDILYIKRKTNKYYYISNNNLGLIYLTKSPFQNINLGIKHVKIAGFGEYPFAQNNLGLIYQYYLNDIENAKYFFEKALKNKFALSAFNLGHIYAIEGNYEESLNYYLKALEYENEPLIFHNHMIYDEQLELSKLFIICLTNLILTEYYLTNKELTKAMIHFAKSIFHLFAYLVLKSAGYNYSFQFELLGNRKITNIDSFFINFPLFSNSKNSNALGWKCDTIKSEQKSDIEIMSYQIEGSNDGEQKEQNVNQNRQLLTKITNSSYYESNEVIDSSSSCSFQSYSLLTEIKIPSSIETIEPYSFIGCKNLKEITFDEPPSIIEIGSHSFSYCSNITKIIIPSNVKRIESCAFANCINLKKIEFIEPSKLIEIGSSTFKGCKNLKVIKLPSSLKSIGKSIFADCSSIKSIAFKTSEILNLEKSCFKGCTSLTDITLPKSISYINESCFKNCLKLVEIKIPLSVIDIKSKCFQNCISLSKIVIHSEQVSIGESAFEGCSSLSEIFINNSTKSTDSNASTINDLPKKNKSKIGENAFSECKSLTKIDLSFSLLSIGKKCFYKCSSLKTIEIPPTLEIIDDSAFFECSSLNNIVIPSSVKYIGQMAFYKCLSLKTIEIPPSIQYIEESAFLGCASLDMIKLPKCNIFYKYNYPMLTTNEDLHSITKMKGEESIYSIQQIPEIINQNREIFINYTFARLGVSNTIFITINNLFQDEINKIFKEIPMAIQFKIIKHKHFDKNSNIIRIKSKKDNLIRIMKLPRNLYTIFINIYKMKDEIHEIIQEMSNILFQPPYSILFGRIKSSNHISKTNENVNTSSENIDESFYEGFYDADIKEVNEKYIIKNTLNTTLSSLIQQNHKFTTKEIYIIFLGIAESMNYLHSHNIIYRYLNPYNIYIDKNYHPLILCYDNNCPSDEDFDETKILKLSPSTNKMETSKKAQLFMAPELISSNKCTFKSDVYSYATVLYEIFKDKIQWPEHNTTNTKKNSIQIIMSLFDRNCLSLNPENRPSFTEILEKLKNDRYHKIIELEDDEIDEYLLSLEKEEEEDMLDEFMILKRKTDKGNVESMLKCADLLIKGEGVETNKSKAIEYLKAAIEKGNTKAMSRYGYMLMGGNGIEANSEEAVRYFKMAMDKGDIEVMNNYAYMLQYGKGVEMNKKEAAFYFKKSADQGNACAMNNYAFMLHHGDGIPSNKEEATKYYKNAIKRGSSNAMVNYASMLEKGDGVPINKEEAAKLYKMSADLGNSNAMNNLARLLQTGDGVLINKEESIHYYKLAIEKGNSSAMNNLAFMYQCGDGVQVDKEKALHFYKMAVDKGNTSAMYNYAMMLQFGDGVDVDKKEALKYYKLSADRGNLNAMISYARMLYKGDGISIDKQEAAEYFKMAAYKGNSIAMTKFASMLYKGDGIQVNKSEAVRYYIMAIQKDNVNAMICYADMLYSGDGVQVDKEKALNLYQMAADKGNKSAMKKLENLIKNI